MKVLIYSDVHGNLPAFEHMLKKVGPCDQYICLGDLVNYGPWSNECIDLALSLKNSVIISGNHEEAFIEGKYPGENNLVKTFFEVTYKEFDRHDILSSFMSNYSLDDFTCQHTILDQYIYPDTSVSLDANYLIGHSHHQFSYESNGFKLFNAGSVGQNRKYINFSNYILYEDGKFIMEGVVYPFELLISEMVSRQYPQFCIDYYLNKELL